MGFLFRLASLTQRCSSERQKNWRSTSNSSWDLGFPSAATCGVGTAGHSRTATNSASKAGNRDLQDERLGLTRTAVRIPHPRIKFWSSRPLVHKVVSLPGLRLREQNFYLGIFVSVMVLVGGSRGHWRRTTGGISVAWLLICKCTRGGFDKPRWKRKGV